MTFEGLGRVLHGAQDFYAHSNWADTPDPTRPVGVDNPPGLNLPGPSPVLDLHGSPLPGEDGRTSGGHHEAGAEEEAMARADRVPSGSVPGHP